MLWHICKFCFALIFLFRLNIDSAQAQQVQVTAAVPPVHTLILDRNHQITKILSNTNSQNPAVLARQHSESGREISITPSILADYQKLKSKYTFSSTGVVYYKQSFFPAQLIHWLHLSFT
jgi:hypothetical protein